MGMPTASAQSMNRARCLVGRSPAWLSTRAIFWQPNRGARLSRKSKPRKACTTISPKRGGRPIMWKTGHSLIKSKMKQEQAVLAGEMSGHMFFADRYFGYDDAIYASCRLVEILTKTTSPLSALVADLPKTAVTPEIRVDTSDAIKFELVKRVQERLSGLRQDPARARSVQACAEGCGDDRRRSRHLRRRLGSDPCVEHAAGARAAI